MKIKRLIIILFLMHASCFSYAQKTISEGTINYDIVIQPKKNGAIASNSLNGATTAISLKGNLSKTEMNSSLGTETTIYNAKLGSGVILKEYSGQKLMITLTKDNWESINRKFAGITFTDGNDTKNIEGYNCKRAIAKLKDGSSISVYYTTELIALNKEYNPAFKTLGGFPIAYEFETDKLLLKFQLSKIDFSPLSSTKFDFPKTGFRIMSYDENVKGKPDNM